MAQMGFEYPYPALHVKLHALLVGPLEVYEAPAPPFVHAAQAVA